MPLLLSAAVAIRSRGSWSVAGRRARVSGRVGRGGCVVDGSGLGLLESSGQAPELPCSGDGRILLSKADLGRLVGGRSITKPGGGCQGASKVVVIWHRRHNRAVPRDLLGPGPGLGDAAPEPRSGAPARRHPDRVLDRARRLGRTLGVEDDQRSRGVVLLEGGPSSA